MTQNIAQPPKQSFNFKDFIKKRYLVIITVVVFLTVILLTLFVDNLFRSDHSHPASTLVTSGGISQNWQNLLNILTAPGILLTDALHLGGLQAVILNMFLTVGVNFLIVAAFRKKIDGPTIAGLLTIAGFTFFGKNVWNALPIYIGVWAYTKWKKVDIKSIMSVLLLSSGISPVTSYLLFGLGMQMAVPQLWGRLIIMLVGGFIVGFLIPIVSSQCIKFTNGINLYNTGFTMGIIAIFVHGILRSTGVHVQFVAVRIGLWDGWRFSDVSYPDYTIILYVMLGLFFLGLILVGWLKDRKAFTNYKKILKSTGILFSDFTEIGGFGATLVNMGVMGLIILVIITPLILILGVPFLATLGGAILTIVGFAAFGKHPGNALPIIGGTIIGFIIVWIIDSRYLLVHSEYSLINIHVYISAVFFATCLSPMSKEYGWVQGMITGVIHMMVVMLVRSFQGGFDLYNNGFGAGFMAGFLVPIFDAFKKKKVPIDEIFHDHEHLPDPESVLVGEPLAEIISEHEAIPELVGD